MKILNYGSLNLDYVYQVDEFVKPGETLMAKSQAVNLGGKGLNQSIALSRAGAQVYHAGCLGKGGDMLKQLLTDNNVNTDFIRNVDEIQGNAVIQVDSHGQNCIVLFGGSNMCNRREYIMETLNKFDEGDYLLLQNEINELSFIVDCAYEKKMKIILNPSPYNENLNAIDFNKLTWILVNEIEAAQIAGLDGVCDPDEVWKLIHDRYSKLSAVITLGDKGAKAFEVIRDTVNSHFCPAQKVNPVDTTAAGDTFTGYFIKEIMDGAGIRSAVNKAIKASAIAVTRKGAADSVPYADEIIG